MKKILLIILVITLLGGGTYLYLQKSSPASDFESIVPDGPIAYIEVTDAEKNLNRFMSSQFFESLANLDPGEVSPVSNPLKQFREALESDESIKSFMTIVKHKVALVVYDINIDFAQTMKTTEFPLDQMFKVLESFYVLIELDAGMKAAEIIASALQAFGDGVSVEKKEHSGHTYQVVTAGVDQPSISYTRLGNVLVVTLAENAMRKAIDVKNGAQTSLASDAKFQAARKDTAGDIFGYYSFDHLTQLMETMFASVPDDIVKNQAQKQLTFFEGLNYGVFSSDWDEFISMHWIIDYDSAKLHKDYVDNYESCVGEQNKTIKFVPQDVLGYYWAGCIDWRQMLEEVKQGLGQIQNSAATGAMAFAEPYLNILGSDMGGFLTDIEQGVFPIPNLMLFIGLNDVEAVQTMIAPFLESPFARIEALDYEGQKVFKVQLPVNVIMPGYAFIDKHLVIATHVSQLQESIALSKGKGKSLTDNDTYKNIGLGSSKDGNSAQYFELSRLMTKLLAYEDFSKSMLRQQEEKKQAFMEGSVRRLEDIQTRINRKQEELKKQEDEVTALEDALFLDETKGLDVSVQRRTIEDLQSDMATLKTDIEVAREQEADTQAILDSYTDTVGQTASIEATLDHVAVPLLNALKNIDVFAGKATTTKDKTKTKFILKVK